MQPWTAVVLIGNKADIVDELRQVKIPLPLPPSSPLLSTSQSTDLSRGGSSHSEGYWMLCIL
jgi:hypothetical protein